MADFTGPGPAPKGQHFWDVFTTESMSLLQDRVNIIWIWNTVFITGSTGEFFQASGAGAEI